MNNKEEGGSVDPFIVHNNHLALDRLQNPAQLLQQKWFCAQCADGHIEQTLKILPAVGHQDT
jgi:hypothetical protein